MPHAAVVALAIVVGLVIGDWLEFPVTRLGAHDPMDRPWRRCSACAAASGRRSLVPLLDVSPRRSPCRACGQREPHPWRPAVLGILTAGLLGLFAARFGADVALAPFAAFGVGLVALSAVDVERFIIPNRIVYPTLAIVAPLLLVASAADHRWGSLGRAAAGGALAFAAMFAVHFLYPKGMGFGDVRLSGLIGLATGWLGLGHVFVAFFAGFVLASVVGLGAGAVTGQGRHQRLPFGPFLAAGAVVTTVVGNPVVRVLFHHTA